MNSDVSCATSSTGLKPPPELPPVPYATPNRPNTMQKRYSTPRLDRLRREANQNDPLKWTEEQYMNFRAQPPPVVCRAGLRLLLGLLPCLALAKPAPTSEN